MEILGKPLCSI